MSAYRIENGRVWAWRISNEVINHYPESGNNTKPPQDGLIHVPEVCTKNRFLRKAKHWGLRKGNEKQTTTGLGTSGGCLGTTQGIGFVCQRDKMKKKKNGKGLAWHIQQTHEELELLLKVGAGEKAINKRMLKLKSLYAVLKRKNQRPGL